MIADAIANYLDNIEEREFDAPFMALLRAHGFYDLHFLHGPFEFGKDFIAKRNEKSGTSQYAFQTKAGDINLADWNLSRGQIDLLRTNSLAHPSFDSKLPRRAAFVTTGRLVGGAPLAAQQYAEHLAQLGESGFGTWDMDTLIELMTNAPDSGLAGAASGALLALLGKIDEGMVLDADIETYSRRWFDSEDEKRLRLAPLEAAIIASKLRNKERLDLAAFVVLCLVRGAWANPSRVEPPSDASLVFSDVGRQLFRQYAGDLVARLTDEVIEPQRFIFGHNEPSATVTYPVRCSKTIEILGLFGLLESDMQSDASKVASLLAKFCDKNPGTTHPISDRWASSLIPASLLLRKTGHERTLTELLKGVIKWVGDRYESGSFGLADVPATPMEEVEHLLGSPFEHVALTKRMESYIATVVLDLTATMEMSELYGLARNEFLAVGAFPIVIEAPDSPSQCTGTALDLRCEVNMPYKDKWEPDDGWKVAPHHNRAPENLYLDCIGRGWDLFAISSVLRDRHYVTSWRRWLKSKRN